MGPSLPGVHVQQCKHMTCCTSSKHAPSSCHVKERAATVKDNCTIEQHSRCHACTAGTLGLATPLEAKLAVLCLVSSSWPSSDGVSCLWLRVYQEFDPSGWFISCTKAFTHLGVWSVSSCQWNVGCLPSAPSTLAFFGGFWYLALILRVSCSILAGGLRSQQLCMA